MPVNLRSPLVFVGVCYALIWGQGVFAEGLRVGYFDLPPHASAASDSGSQSVQGAAVEYFKQVSKGMGLTEPSFHRYPLARLLHMLDTSKIDVVLLLGKNPERASKFNYPVQPYYLLRSAIAVDSSSDIKAIQGIDDLLVLKIGIWKQGYLSPLLRDERLTLDPLSGGQILKRSMKKLLSQRIDAFYSPDYFALVAFVENAGLSEQIRIIELPEKGLGAYSVFSARAAKKHVGAYEKALADHSKKVPYEQFLKDHIKGLKDKR